jgi:hypothetical protein
LRLSAENKRPKCSRLLFLRLNFWQKPDIFSVYHPVRLFTRTLGEIAIKMCYHVVLAKKHSQLILCYFIGKEITNGT